MSLKRFEKYPGRFDGATSGHPQGAFKNRTSPTTFDGSYLERDWANDWDGFFGSLLTSAGITPNGNVDAVGASQYYDALLSITTPNVADYDALRDSVVKTAAYYITGVLVTSAPSGIAGSFLYDATDTTTPDNGGTVIVGVGGRRYKRADMSSITPEMFEAKGDGVTDDTVKLFNCYASVPEGSTIYFDPTASYLLSSAFVLNRNVKLDLGTRDGGAVIKFIGGGSYFAAPYNYCMIAKHSSTPLAGYTGDASRSEIVGGKIMGDPSLPAGQRGFLGACPTYIKFTRFSNFPDDGCTIGASTVEGVIGNANGSTLEICAANGNGGNGFVTDGNDANACVLTRCNASGNGLFGFYDRSLLGNTFLQCETDANTTGGYAGRKDVPQRSTYIGCYAEGNQPILYDVNKQALRINPQGATGATSASDGVALTVIPTGELYHSKRNVFADNENIANAGGTGAYPGKYAALDQNGLRFRGAAGDPLLSLNKTSNYYNWSCDATNVHQIVITDPGIGNLKPFRSVFPFGIVIGTGSGIGSGISAIVGSGTAAPTTGDYRQGAIFLNTVTVAIGFIGWVCVTSSVGGNGGTWKTFGAISA